jgi:hypothetical protein
MRLFKQPPILQNISLVSLKNKIKMNSLFSKLPPIIYTPTSNRNPTKLVTKSITKPPALHKTIISTYRLGDLVLLQLSQEEKKEILIDHPNTIGSKYIIEKNKNIHIQNIDLFTKIVQEYIEKNKEVLPKDIENSTVIHLRLGDVIAGNEWHEKLKRPLDINSIIKSIQSNSKNKDNKKYILGKCFFTKCSSINYDECITLSNNYLEEVINSLNAEHFDSGNADIDLCCAIKAKLFVQGKGYFSKLIVETRKKLNLENIETNCC